MKRTKQRLLRLGWLIPLLSVAMFTSCNGERSSQKSQGHNDSTAENANNTSRPVLAPEQNGGSASGSSAGTVPSQEQTGNGDAAGPATDHSMGAGAQQSAARTLHSDAGAASSVPVDPAPHPMQPQTPQPTSDH
jgi:hypothetical protein